MAHSPVFGLYLKNKNDRVLVREKERNVGTVEPR